VTDIPAEEKSTIEVEHFHRRRAQIEERFKDAKLGQPLRHLPSGDMDANRLWLACCLLALNITAMICDISPAAGACTDAPDGTPLRRHAKALRQILFCVPARITRTARQTIVHLPDGFRHLHVFKRPTRPPTRSAPRNTPRFPSPTTSRRTRPARRPRIHAHRVPSAPPRRRPRHPDADHAARSAHQPRSCGSGVIGRSAAAAEA
jgi:hypothetical protein